MNCREDLKDATERSLAEHLRILASKIEAGEIEIFETELKQDLHISEGKSVWLKGQRCKNLSIKFREQIIESPARKKTSIFPEMKFTKEILPLSDEVICITGHFPHEGRSDIVAWCESKGARITSRPKNATALIHGSRPELLPKYATAKRLGIPTFTFADFIQHTTNQRGHDVR